MIIKFQLIFDNNKYTFPNNKFPINSKDIEGLNRIFKRRNETIHNLSNKNKYIRNISNIPNYIINKILMNL